MEELVTRLVIGGVGLILVVGGLSMVTSGMVLGWGLMLIGFLIGLMAAVFPSRLISR